MAGSDSDHALVAERYLVDLSRPMPSAGGGVSAFAALDQRAVGAPELMALRVTRDAPARAAALKALVGQAAAGILLPLAHGNGPPIGGDGSYFVICPAPPGRPLAAETRPWPEAALLDLVLRPIATALAFINEHGQTHRAIRPNNVFNAGPSNRVVLGAAWSGPPAQLQPALFEPPYSAACLPVGRGAGCIADDVYALGVLLITLALGRMPLAGIDDVAVIRRKLELGSYVAIVGDDRLPPVIADMARGMLAEDPDHRTPLPLLLDPGSARGRRVATRPPRRAQRPMQIGAFSVSEARGLAHAIGADTEEGLKALSNGNVMTWLRRNLGDSALAVRLEEIVRYREGGLGNRSEDKAIALMSAIAVIDPLAPMCWRGTVLWPDAIGAVMAGALMADARLMGALEEMIRCEATAFWAMMRAERSDLVAARQDARQQRSIMQIRGIAGGMPRLAYVLSPFCRVPARFSRASGSPGLRICCRRWK